jgi:hypothetical protein
MLSTPVRPPHDLEDVSPRGAGQSKTILAKLEYSRLGRSRGHFWPSTTCMHTRGTNVFVIKTSFWLPVK